MRQVRVRNKLRDSVGRFPIVCVWMRLCPYFGGRESVDQVSGVVTGGDQQVRQHQELVVCELLLMLLPVVVVCPPEV